MQLLKVFYPETSEQERRQLAAVVPPPVRAAPHVYEPYSFDELRALFDAHLPAGKDEYRPVMWESVRQLLGGLGYGDVGDNQEKQAALFEMLDVGKDGKLSFEELMQWYLDLTEDHPDLSG